MKTTKYVFTRSLNLGGVDLNVKNGEPISFNGKSYIYKNKKFDDTKDFEIAIKNGWLVEQKLYKSKEDIKSLVNKDYKFGFGIVKEQEQSIVPIAKILNQKRGFVEQDGKIKDLDNTVHVADVPKKNNLTVIKNTIEETSNNPLSAFLKKIADSQKDDTSVEQLIKQQQEEIKTAKRTKKQTKKETAPKSKKQAKTKKTESKSTKKVTDRKSVSSVRGMKIIKGQ